MLRCKVKTICSQKFAHRAKFPCVMAMLKKIWKMKTHMAGGRGGSRIFSRGADLQKIYENFDDFFFKSTKLIFRALLKH